MATVHLPLWNHKYGFETSALAAQLELLPAAPANVKIRVTSMVASSLIAQVLTFGTDEVAISGIFYITFGQPLVLPYNELGWFETLAAEPLDVLLGVATSTGFTFTYVLTT